MREPPSDLAALARGEGERERCLEARFRCGLGLLWWRVCCGEDFLRRSFSFSSPPRDGFRSRCFCRNSAARLASFVRLYSSAKRRCSASFRRYSWPKPSSTALFSRSAVSSPRLRLGLGLGLVLGLPPLLLLLSLAPLPLLRNSSVMRSQSESGLGGSPGLTSQSRGLAGMSGVGRGLGGCGCG